MKAAMVNGCEFVQGKNGYWIPELIYIGRAKDVLRDIVEALGFQRMVDYLKASSKPDAIREKMRQLLETMEKEK